MHTQTHTFLPWALPPHKCKPRLCPPGCWGGSQYPNQHVNGLVIYDNAGWLLVIPNCHSQIWCAEATECDNNLWASPHKTHKFQCECTCYTGHTYTDILTNVVGVFWLFPSVHQSENVLCRLPYEVWCSSLIVFAITEPAVVQKLDRVITNQVSVVRSPAAPIKVSLGQTIDCI